MFKLMLDYGHGGHDPGAVNPATGLREANVVRLVGRHMLVYLKPFEEAGLIQVGQTSNPHNDKFVSLTERANIANRFKADLSVSIHCNSAMASTAHGFECFSSPGLTASDKDATILLHQFKQDFPDRRMRVDESDGDPDKEAHFTFLKKTRGRAVLFELEFIHNSQGHAFLSPTGNQKRMAFSLVTGILQSANIGYHRIESTMKLSPILDLVPDLPVPTPSPTVDINKLRLEISQLETSVARFKALIDAT